MKWLIVSNVIATLLAMPMSLEDLTSGNNLVVFKGSFSGFGSSSKTKPSGGSSSSNTYKTKLPQSDLTDAVLKPFSKKPTGTILIPLTSKEYSHAYTANVLLGEKQQQLFEVIIDTGSEAFWVPDKTCTFFNSTGAVLPNSGTLYEGKADPGIPDDPKVNPYGIGTAKTVKRTDYFAFGNSKKSTKIEKEVKFEVAIETIDLARGIFGLDRKSLYGPNNVLGLALAEKLTPRSMFTVFLNKCPIDTLECGDGGLLTLGAHDNENCGEIVGFTEVNRYADHWQFEAANVKLVRLGGAVDMDENLHSNPLNYIGTTKNEKTLSDSGSSHLTIDPEDFKEIRKKFGANVAARTDVFLLDCNIKQWELRIEINGKDYAIPSDALMGHYEGERLCEVLIKPAEYGFWILGQPFLRSWCHIYDWQLFKLLFAKPGTKETDKKRIYTASKEEEFNAFMKALQCKPESSKKQRRKRSTEVACLLEQSNPKSQPKSVPCKDNSNMCQHWKKNKFCKSRYFSRAVKLSKCAKTCDMCK